VANERQPWDDVYDQINVLRHPDSIHTAPLTDADLDAVEFQLGSLLPQSYRAFLKRFGPGELECSLRVTPILHGVRRGYTLLEETAGQREFFAKHYEEQNGPWLGRVVYFGCNAGGDPYVWDPVELTSSGTGECPVYWLVRHEENQPERCANSFFEFVREELTRLQAWRAEEPPEEGIPANSFVPWHLRFKVEPQPSDVQLWLTYSNVRDLALAIRDHGRADAFPALADALQEAGCANADVLDSCRRGDPEIDGVWVLRVLLGEK